VRVSWRGFAKPSHISLSLNPSLTPFPDRGGKGRGGRERLREGCFITELILSAAEGLLAMIITYYSTLERSVRSPFLDE
jgi:hypothetical protein